MPELPEVETVRRGLIPEMEGKRIVKAVQNRPDLRWPLPKRFAERLTGQRVARIGRRGKYLLLDLESAAETLIVHLGMSGRFLIHSGAGDTQGGKHDHVVLDIEGGARAIFNDARRFGSMDLWPTDTIETHKLLAGMGPEPLSNEFSAGYLKEAFTGRKTTLKAALLDQRRVAGLGNIYVCEALHMARLSPMRAAGSISAKDCTTLVAAIRDTLEKAINAGGSSLRDFHGASGELGYFQHTFSVYDREDAPCPRRGCKGKIARTVQSARSTFHCTKCQK
ncbi:UNVERIFIED_CONTAM: hypothetical protein GTU68_031082 [Idotea baltica]|nr:hypothetical protein [Idotea baltica]